LEYWAEEGEACVGRRGPHAPRDVGASERAGKGPSKVWHVHHVLRTTGQQQPTALKLLKAKRTLSAGIHSLPLMNCLLYVNGLPAWNCHRLKILQAAGSISAKHSPLLAGWLAGCQLGWLSLPAWLSDLQRASCPSCMSRWCPGSRPQHTSPTACCSSSQPGSSSNRTGVTAAQGLSAAACVTHLKPRGQQSPQQSSFTCTPQPHLESALCSSEHPHPALGCNKAGCNNDATPFKNS